MLSMEYYVHRNYLVFRILKFKHHFLVNKPINPYKMKLKCMSSLVFLREDVCMSEVTYLKHAYV